jgi:hypothetical protein
LTDSLALATVLDSHMLATALGSHSCTFLSAFSFSPNRRVAFLVIILDLVLSVLFFFSISDVGYMLIVSMFRFLTSCVSPRVIYKECRTLSKLSNTATYLVIEINCNTFVFVLWLCELYFFLSNKNSLQSVWNLHILDLYFTYEMLFCWHWLLIDVLVAMLHMFLLATHLWEHHYFLSHLCELYVVNYVLMVF